MSLRHALLPVVDRLRALAGPTNLDVRPYRVWIRTRTWSGSALQLGAPTDVDREIVPPPKVVEINRELKVGPITPAYPGGGYSPADLNPADQPNVEFVYLLLGPDGVKRPFALIDLDTTRSFGYFLRLMALDRNVPF